MDFAQLLKLENSHENGHHDRHDGSQLLLGAASEITKNCNMIMNNANYHQLMRAALTLGVVWLVELVALELDQPLEYRCVSVEPESTRDGHAPEIVSMFSFCFYFNGRSRASGSSPVCKCLGCWLRHIQSHRSARPQTYFDCYFERRISHRLVYLGKRLGQRPLRQRTACSRVRDPCERRVHCKCHDSKLPLARNSTMH